MNINIDSITIIIVQIPNADRAIVDLRKLRDYALSNEHHVGRHKARLFRDTIRIGQEDAGQIRSILLEVVKSEDAQPGERDYYGQRYRLDFTLEWRGYTARIRSAWIIRSGENFPRLVTCYPLEDTEE